MEFDSIQIPFFFEKGKQMKILKIITLLSFIGVCVIPISKINAGKKPIKHTSVQEIKKPYMGKCSWFEINSNAAINPNAHNYVAMRWDYDALAKKWNLMDYNKKTKKWKPNKSKVVKKLKTCWVLIENPKTKGKIWGRPADWGPAKWTGRHIDLDPTIMHKIDCVTDDVLIATLYEKRTFM